MAIIKKGVKKWQSMAMWPSDISVGDYLNRTFDMHNTEGQALAVVQLLLDKGFGGDGKVFPLSTGVSEID